MLGVLDQDVLLSDLVEDLSGLHEQLLLKSFEALRHLRCMRGVPVLRKGSAEANRHKVCQPNQVAREHKHISAVQDELLHQEVQELCWHVLSHFQSRSRGAAAPVDFLPNKVKQVVALTKVGIINHELDVPRDAEWICLEHLHTFRDQVHIVQYNFFYGDVLEPLVIQLHGPGFHRRHPQVHPSGLVRFRVQQHHRQVDSVTLKQRKRVGLIDRQRRQDRQNLLLKVRRHVPPLLRIELLPRENFNTELLHLRKQLRKKAVVEGIHCIANGRSQLLLEPSLRPDQLLVVLVPILLILLIKLGDIPESLRVYLVHVARNDAAELKPL
mmetsp:Transcript_16688/g.68356  ORF Transcript_16688/g.68356 Transcript_16688/m.68356 type:complete len:326 (+) Transcript_16688:2867-3844(+)